MPPDRFPGIESNVPFPAMTTARPLLRRVLAGVLVFALAGWLLLDHTSIGAPEGNGPGAPEMLMLGGVALAPIAAPIVTSLLAKRRE